MGANSDFQKCGSVLINIKTIKNKSKVFTFHCAFCNMDCDQLKKFSHHLEKEHLHHFENELGDKDEQQVKKCPLLLFEPEEIKVEQELDMETFNEGYGKISNNSSSSHLYQDPLETEKFHNNKALTKDCNIEEFTSTNVENGHESTKKETEDCDVATSNTSTNCIQEVDFITEETNKDTNNSYTIHMLKDLSSDDFSDNSEDTDFDFKNELNATKPTRKSKTESKRKSTENNENDGKKPSSTNRTKRRRRTIIDEILPTLIQKYKKYEILWQVNKIEFGVKNKKYEVYSKIIDELKLEHDVIISLEDINYHINYLNELYSKDKDQELKCKIEKKKFVPEYEHYTLLSFLSESQGPFLCATCNEVLPKYDSYCQHTAQHNGTQPYKCPSCEVLFANYHKYLLHKKRHLGVYNFHCDICGKGYLFKNDLEWHVTSHTGDKPYLCQICGTGFRARHGYDNHIRRHEERFRYECHICKRGFNQLHVLNNHVKAHLNVRDIICKICGKGFVHNKYLKRHQQIHGEVKNYKCKECGKAFFQACGLRAHKKNHHS